MKRSLLIKGMVFFAKIQGEVLILDWKDNSNTWSCDYIAGDCPDEYVRHDYIFTDSSHGYQLVGMRFGEDEAIKFFEGNDDAKALINQSTL